MNFLFPSFHSLRFICFSPRSEKGTSPNQSCCSLPVTYKYQPVRALRAWPRNPEGLSACVEDALRLELAGGVRHRHGRDVAQAGTKGEGLSVNHLLRKERLLSALLSTLLFSRWSDPRLHSCTVANLALSTAAEPLGGSGCTQGQTQPFYGLWTLPFG